MNKVLVIGGTGFVGSNLLRELVARGISVRLLHRKASDLEPLRELPVETCIGDLLDYRSLCEAMKGCTHVFHLAAVVSFSSFFGKRMEQESRLGTANVIRAVLEAGIEKMVYTSTACTAGTGSRAEPASEAHGVPLSARFLPYVRAKLAAEELILEAVREKRLPATLVLPGAIFGPGENPPKVNRFFIDALAGRLRYYFPGGLPLVSISDAVNGHLLAMEKGKIGERYIIANENVSFREFFRIVNSCAGKSAPRFCVPTPVSVVMGAVIDTLRALGASVPDFSVGAALYFSSNHFVTSAKAERELEYRPANLEAEIARTLQWLSRSRLPTAETYTDCS